MSDTTPPKIPLKDVIIRCCGCKCSNNGEQVYADFCRYYDHINSQMIRFSKDGITPSAFVRLNSMSFLCECCQEEKEEEE